MFNDKELSKGSWLWAHGMTERQDSLTPHGLHGRGFTSVAVAALVASKRKSQSEKRVTQFQRVVLAGTTLKVPVTQQIL